MRKNNHNIQRKTGAGATASATRTEKPVYTAEQRETTMQQGLRILVRIIARYHLRGEASRAAQEPAPPP